MADLSPGGFEVTRLSLSDEMFELGEDLFDGIEVGAVGRQEKELGFGRADGGASGLAFVAAEVVQDDDIAWREGRSENLLDVEEEGFAVDRPSITQGASILSWRSAAMKVKVFQWPSGA